MDFKDTFDNPDWLNKNCQTLVNVFPETWTNISNLNQVAVGFQLKLIGLDFRSTDDLGAVFAQCEKRKVFLRDGYLIRRNIHYRPALV